MIELTGSLSDGRNFNLKLTVGKDFQVGASYAATLTNMKTQLEKTGDDATMITLNDGSQVKDARDVTNRSNEAVVVDDLTDLDAVASKFADAINGVANKNLNADGSVPYTAVADGTTVKITTSEVGSDVKAMEITTPYGDEVPTVSFKFDPSKIKAGSYMTISDGKTSNTYEFVKTGEKPKSGNTAIEISDFN